MTEALPGLVPCSVVLSRRWRKEMKLNCKQGDLAVIVRSYAGNEGAVVTCLRLIPNWTRPGLRGGWRTGPGWETDRNFVKANGLVDNIVADDQLRPLRDSDGEDEVLRLVGRPVGTPQAA
jgi:hypothetical protein